MPSFEDDWRCFYPGADPIGWMMRRAGAKHWVRFHSLPASKRYAETDEERGILLARQNALADVVLGPQAPCWLAQIYWETPEGYVDLGDDLHPQLKWPNDSFQQAFRFLADEGDDEEHAWNAYASNVRWVAGAFDDLLRAIADEDAAPTLWMSTASGAVFAPYDGGVDLFLPSAGEVAVLKAAHGEWLSDHPSGL